MQEAMNQVKETLGRDAIILHTRKFRKGGIGGFFGREMIEVMAAVDNDIPVVTLSSTTSSIAKPKAKAKKTSGAPVKSLIRPSAKSIKVAEENNIVKEKIIEQSVKTEINSDKEVFERITVAELLQKNIESQTQPKEAASPVTLEPLALTRLISNKEDAPTPLISVKSDINSIVEAEDTKADDLKSEISGMRQMLEQLLAKTKTAPTNLWYDYLTKRDLLPVFAEHILKGFPYALTMLNKNPEATKKMLYDRLASYIRTTEGINLCEEGTCKKIALIGPTGVGKTTTLAKLAARFTLDTNANVAFITSDTYRIAAVEQLKTYANILNIPLDVVYSPEEMKKCLNKHQDKQLILIDTAGRSQYNEEQMEELKALIATDENIEPHLVLSSTTKHQDAVDIIKRFTYCSSEHLIFTKIDEARNIGNIFNIMYEFPELMISYITDGQSVPDDIHLARPSYLTDILLRD